MNPNLILLAVVVAGAFALGVRIHDRKCRGCNRTVNVWGLSPRELRDAELSRRAVDKPDSTRNAQ